jgi:2-methylisocitrate lyase-like PEP mutase family enzyme
MSTQAEKAEQFRALHVPGQPLLLPNPWDQGSARVLVTCGFSALATTSAGFAATLGRRDGSVTRDEALDHAALIVGAVDVPVSADLENGFADGPGEAAVTYSRAVEVGLAGGSIEDSTGDTGDPIYPLELAAERVAAAAAAAHDAGPFVLTARSENYLHGRPDIDDTIARLQAYEAAGADCLYAPGLSDVDDIRRVVESVSLPVNVLALPSAPSVAELAAVGVARISVGGAFAFVALGAVVDASRELLDEGTYGYLARLGAARGVIVDAFTTS